MFFQTYRRRDLSANLAQERMTFACHSCMPNVICKYRCLKLMRQLLVLFILLSDAFSISICVLKHRYKVPWLHGTFCAVRIWRWPILAWFLEQRKNTYLSVCKHEKPSTLVDIWSFKLDVSTSKPSRDYICPNLAGVFMGFFCGWTINYINSYPLKLCEQTC